QCLLYHDDAGRGRFEVKRLLNTGAAIRPALASEYPITSLRQARKLAFAHLSTREAPATANPPVFASGTVSRLANMDAFRYSSDWRSFLGFRALPRSRRGSMIAIGMHAIFVRNFAANVNIPY